MVTLTLKSNPFSAANRFAKGLARIREPTWIGVEVFGAAGLGGGGGGVGAEVDDLGGEGAAGVGASAAPSSTKSLKAATSASFSTIMHTS